MTQSDAAPPPQPPPASPGPDAVTQQERTWGMLCHLLAFCGIVFPGGGNIIGPLVMWLVKKDESAFVNDQGKESLNFQITVTIAGLICAALIPLLCIGFVLMIAVSVTDVVMVIVASMAASKGARYRYPWALRLIK